ncbi:hypothetical protein C2L64_48305 [Paraburkholderia hospita]|uniref:Uncharacterized protein n=1 Tax=Paraburkholderia hospita TaxID=169430 RepID=A0AAN1MQQ4_9BURK|nr:hypothetical protein C2L64_48305 [Paraburkholderia hospita]OUL96020.1 hypothetical protein CA601_03385 [Paraburkholderia hospita]
MGQDEFDQRQGQLSVAAFSAISSWTVTQKCCPPNLQSEVQLNFECFILATKSKSLFEIPAYRLANGEDGPMLVLCPACSESGLTALES